MAHGLHASNNKAGQGGWTLLGRARAARLESEGFRMTRRRFRAWFLLLFALAPICLGPSPASAWWQTLHRRKVVPKEPSGQSVTLSGVVQRVTPTEIEVLVDPPAKGERTPKNKNAPHGTWTATTPRGTKFRVEGEATPDYLRSGLLVQVSAKVEGREIKEPLHQLTIISKGRATAHAPASPSKPAGKGNGSSPATLGSESSQIVGQLGRTQKNEWLLHVGEKSYRIQLADDLTIKVALSNGHLISAGDKIVVHGEAIQGKPSTCIADDVQATLTHPLSAKGKPKASEHVPGLDPSGKK
jgi:hypothetical protein